MSALTARERAILLTAGRALLDASWHITTATTALSNDRELAHRVVDGWDGDLDSRDLEGMQESINRLGNDLLGVALQ